MDKLIVHKLWERHQDIVKPEFKCSFVAFYNWLSINESVLLLANETKSGKKEVIHYETT